MKLNSLIAESTISASSPNGRPNLLDFTRSVNNLIYTDLVAVQPTNMPVSALYGLRYMNANNDMSYTTGATYSGEYGDQHSTTPVVTAGSYQPGTLIKLDDVLYQVINPITITNVNIDVYTSAMKGDIRIASESAPTSKFETANSIIQEANFKIDKWQADVKTRKLKTEITLETLQDLDAAGADAQKVIKDFLVTMISEEINKDIIQRLITVSKRWKVKGLSENGYIDYSAGTDDITSDMFSYRLTRIVSEMAASATRRTGFNPNYVLASSRVGAILQAAGIKQTPGQKSPGFLTKLGMNLYIDTTCPFDYVIVGVKQDTDDKNEKMEAIGSLVYSPFLQDDMAGVIQVVKDPDSLQDNIAIMTRYSLSVNPYATTQDDFNDIRITKGDDWKNLVGRSDMSMFLGIILPEYLNDDVD